MARVSKRPLSPHLTIWRWGPHAIASIMHRATGTAMAVGGGVMLIWWLAAAASGETSYATFLDWMTPDAGGFGLAGLNVLPFLVLLGLTWAFFQHMCSGLRHFVLDTGAGYELATNRLWARMTFVGGIVFTILFWALIWSKR